MIFHRGNPDGGLYRYVSTMGDRYAWPIYFESADEAIGRAEYAKKLIGGLTGQDSMIVEAMTDDGEWLQLWPEQVS